MNSIKIRLKSGKWLPSRAYPTSHPQLFVTPLYAAGKSKQPRFFKHKWTITHKRSGYSIISGAFTIAAARALAELFAESSIPWERLRSQRDAVRYREQHHAVMRKFKRKKKAVLRAS